MEEFAKRIDEKIKTLYIETLGNLRLNIHELEDIV